MFQKAMNERAQPAGIGAIDEAARAAAAQSIAGPAPTVLIRTRAAEGAAVQPRELAGQRLFSATGRPRRGTGAVAAPRRARTCERPMSPCHSSHRGAPSGGVAAARSKIARTSTGSTSPNPPLADLEASVVIERRGKVQAIARAGHGDIQPGSSSSRSRLAASSSAAERNVPTETAISSSVLERRHTNRVATAAATAPEVHKEDDRELQSLGRVHRHQIHRIDGIHGSRRLVTSGKAIEVIGHPRQRGVATILDPAHQAAHLLEILACLATGGAFVQAAELVGVTRSGPGRGRQAPTAECDRPVPATPARHGAEPRGRRGRRRRAARRHIRPDQAWRPPARGPDARARHRTSAQTAIAETPPLAARSRFGTCGDGK